MPIYESKLANLMLGCLMKERLLKVFMLAAILFSIGAILTGIGIAIDGKPISLIGLSVIAIFTMLLASGVQYIVIGQGNPLFLFQNKNGR